MQRITEIAGVVVSLDPKPIPVSCRYHLLAKISFSSSNIIQLYIQKKNDMYYG